MGVSPGGGRNTVARGLRHMYQNVTPGFEAEPPASRALSGTDHPTSSTKKTWWNSRAARRSRAKPTESDATGRAAPGAPRPRSPLAALGLRVGRSRGRSYPRGASNRWVGPRAGFDRSGPLEIANQHLLGLGVFELLDDTDEVETTSCPCRRGPPAARAKEFVRINSYGSKRTPSRSFSATITSSSETAHGTP